MSELLKSLKTLYTEKKWDQGVELLLKEKDQFSNDVFHFYLGSFYAKKEALALSRYHFEVAKEKNYSSSEVNNNIELVKNNLGVSMIETPKGSEEILVNFLSQRSNDVLLSFFLICILLSVYLFKKFKNLYIPLLVILISVVPLGLKMKYAKNLSPAIVLSEAGVHEGPSDVFEKSTTMPLGLKLYISKVREKVWYFIEYPQSFKGWVKADHIKFIKD